MTPGSSDIEKRRTPPPELPAEIEPEIVRLPQRVRDLPLDERRRFRRIFRISTATGHPRPPATMDGWIRDFFRSTEAVETQRIVKVTNLVTWEGALYNELRARRPQEVRGSGNLDRVIQDAVGDPFCKPLEGTPADVFGRVKGQHCITACNIAMYDGFSGLVIFDEHHPLRFTQAQVADYIDTAWAWAQKANGEDPEARYFFFMWNCLWKAAASIIHGHAQMALTRELHYPKIESLRRAALLYHKQYRAGYFDDLYAAHAAIGLGLEWLGVRVITYLTPVKERETLLIAPALTDELKQAIFLVADTFVQQLGVCSFNVALHLAPIGALSPELKKDWRGFPVIARIVDRGDPFNQTADIGAMELYAANVIGTDPFFVADALRERFRQS